jgi:hypothetical protein
MLPLLNISGKAPNFSVIPKARAFTSGPRDLACITTVRSTDNQARIEL